MSSRWAVFLPTILSLVMLGAWATAPLAQVGPATLGSYVGSSGTAKGPITTSKVIGGAGTTSTLTLQPTSGVGTAGADIVFKVGNSGATEAWRVLGGGSLIGSLIAGVDNSYDIGASGATRPRTGYFGTSIVVPSINGGTSAQLSIVNANAILSSGNNVAGVYLNHSNGGTINGWAMFGPGMVWIPTSTTNTQDLGGTSNLIRTGYFGTSVISPLFQSSTAKVLVRGTGSGATQLAAIQTTPPTCSASCGTSPSVVGTDTAMSVTMGASGVPASPFTVTFNGTWAAAPACVASLDTAGVTKYVTATVTTTTTVAVNTAIAPGTSDKFHIICIGEQ